jgi:hypothetical protein
MGMKKIEHSEEIQNSGFRMEVGEWGLWRFLD